MQTVYDISVQSTTERVGVVLQSTSIVADGGLIGPLYLVTLVGKHSVGLCTIGDQYTLKSVDLLYKMEHTGSYRIARENYPSILNYCTQQKHITCIFYYKKKRSGINVYNSHR